MKKILLLCLLLLADAVQADIYKCVDESGHAAFADANTKAAYKQCTLIMRDSAGSSASRNSAGKPARSSTPTPKDFPRVDQQTQRQRDDVRRKVLEEEMAGERKALEDAKKNLAEGEANPEVYKGQDGKTYRNVPKFEEKIKKLQEDVALHEKNIQLLEKELASLK